MQRNRDAEIQRVGDSQETHETHEVPLLAARVTALPEAVQLSLQHGFNKDSLFTFCRALKAFQITVARKMSGDDLNDAFSMWWQTAQPLLSSGADFDEFRFVFLDTYGNTHSALGSNSLEEALRLAESSALPKAAKRYTGARLQKLVAVCYFLQRLTCGQPFFLSVRDAARVMGSRDLRMAGQMLGGLVTDEVLRLVEPGKPGGRKAARFRFVAPEFQNLEAAIPMEPVSRPKSETSSMHNTAPAKKQQARQRAQSRFWEK
jgi:hypothetical protein